MFSRRYLLLCLMLFALLGGSGTACAAIVATIGGSPLTNNSTGQTLQVFLTSDTAIADIEAINLYAAIGDATAGQTQTPKFTSFTWNPVITGAFGSPFFSGSTPEVGNDFTATPQVLDFVIDGNGFDLGTSTTLLGTFTIDTTGVSNERFTFFIGDSPGATSDVNFSGNSTSFGTLGLTTFDVGTVTSVPEPGSFAVCCVAAAGIAWRRRNRGKTVKVPALPTTV